MVTTPTDTTRTLELSPQEWTLINFAIWHEMLRWPPEHVYRFTLLRLHNTIDGLLRDRQVNKTVRRKRA